MEDKYLDQQIQIENDMSCQIKENGKLKPLLNNNCILELKNTRVVRELKRNIISLGKLDEKYNILIHKDLTRLYYENKDVASSPKVNEIYTIYVEPFVGHSPISIN